MKRHPDTDMLQLQCRGTNLPHDIRSIMDVSLTRHTGGQEENIASVSHLGTVYAL